MLTRQDRAKDYYGILGVPETASQAEIKSAWKKLVKRWHPDVCKDPEAHAKFIEISEAYQVLQYDWARRRYDYLRQEQRHDFVYHDRQHDFSQYQEDARTQAENLYFLPINNVLLMLQSTAKLAQDLFLLWAKMVFYAPLGYLDGDEKRGA